MTDKIPRIGEFFALLTALCWTVTALSFESAGKKVGSLSVNILRLMIALGFFSIYGVICRGMAFPFDATWVAWKWLGLSAIIGFCIGDLLLFKAFVVVGSRISMLIMSGVPPFTALLGWLFLDEKLTCLAWMGMTITITGICIVIWRRGAKEKKENKVDSHWLKGVLLAMGGGVGQAVGLILSKLGMQEYDAVAATHIRVIVGMVGFALIFTVTGRWKSVVSAVHNHWAMRRIWLGSFFGPFLGVSFSLLSIQHTETGSASTIMAIVPVLIIPPAVILFREKISFMEVFGAILAVIGVALLFI